MAYVTSSYRGSRPRVLSLLQWLAAGMAVSACGSDEGGGSSFPPASIGGSGLGGSGLGGAGRAGSGLGGSGQAGSVAGAAGVGGALSAGGSADSGGAPTSSAGGEGQPDLSGISGASGTGGGAGSTEPEPEVTDERPFFSFFATSQAGMYALPAGQAAPAPSPMNGYGGNLGGLAGADEICTMLARASNPGDQKTWRAFLSTSGFDGGEQVDAIDRVGSGPWYDYNGLLFAQTVADLLPTTNDGRPDGDAELAEMFTDENGEDIRPSQQIDNHDTLTGSGADGRLFDDDAEGRIATCEDWTSSTVRGAEGNMFGGGGQVPVGHSWPRSGNNGRNWISDHTINGCEPGADVDGGAGAPSGDFRVGAGGGFGGIYCFALGAVAPE